MSLIYVRTKVGRSVSEVPGGRAIPSDVYVPVRDTDRIRRFLEVHGDLELKPKSDKKKSDDNA